MLVLSRHRNESIVIDPRSCPVNEQGLIEIMVVDIRGDKVRLGCEAPKGVPVHRREVYDAIERNRRQEADTCDEVEKLSLAERVKKHGSPVG